MNHDAEPETKERPALRIVTPPFRPARDALEGELIGWQLGKYAQLANAIFREMSNGFQYSSADFQVFQLVIDIEADQGRPLAPRYVAARLVAECPTADESAAFQRLRDWSLAALACQTESELRDRISYNLQLLREGVRSDQRRQADDMLHAKGVDAFEDARALLDDAPSVAKTKFFGSGAFVSGFVPLDYLWDGILQRGYLYNLTGQTGAGKTAFALRFIAHIAEGRPFAGRDVEQGSVLMLAGENPDDAQMRWIALSEQFGFVIGEIPVTFRKGLFSIRSELPLLRAHAQAVGGLAAVVMDTENAFFTCDFDDENDNRQRGEWGRVLRLLTTLPGMPTVLALGHPVKNAVDQNLLPRGGGAYLAEIDGNLTATGQNKVGQIHWQGKFRGPEFEPVHFELVEVKSPRLVTSRGRSMPTVVARPLSETEHQQRIDEGNSDVRLLMRAMLDNEGASISELATVLNWRVGKDNQPYKSKVQRLLQKLEKDKLARNVAGVRTLTPSGEKAAKTPTS